HGGRHVDTDDGRTGGHRHGDGHAAVPDRQLDDRPGCFTRQADVERNIFGHGGRPLVVPGGELLVPAHGVVYVKLPRSQASRTTAATAATLAASPGSSWRTWRSSITASANAACIFLVAASSVKP